MVFSPLKDFIWSVFYFFKMVAFVILFSSAYTRSSPSEDTHYYIALNSCSKKCQL